MDGTPQFALKHNIENQNKLLCHLQSAHLTRKQSIRPTTVGFIRAEQEDVTQMYVFVGRSESKYETYNVSISIAWPHSNSNIL